MNTAHAHAILTAIQDFQEQGASEVSLGAFLFDDNLTLAEHINMALGGMSLEAAKAR